MPSRDFTNEDLFFSPMISMHNSTHSSQINTVGPAMSLRTSCWLLPQNVQWSAFLVSPLLTLLFRARACGPMLACQSGEALAQRPLEALHKTRHQNMALRDRAPESDFHGVFSDTETKLDEGNTAISRYFERGPL